MTPLHKAFKPRKKTPEQLREELFRKKFWDQIRPTQRLMGYNHGYLGVISSYIGDLGTDINTILKGYLLYVGCRERIVEFKLGTFDQVVCPPDPKREAQIADWFANKILTPVEKRLLLRNDFDFVKVIQDWIKLRKDV